MGGPYTVTLLNRTPMLLSGILRHVVVNAHHKTQTYIMCSDEIGLCAQNIDPILGSSVNIITIGWEDLSVPVAFCIFTAILMKLGMTILGAHHNC